MIDVKMWCRALDQMPKLSQSEWQSLDPVAKWQIACRASVLFMTFTAAALGGLMGWRAGAFQWDLRLATVLGLAVAGTDPVASKNVVHLLAIGAIGGMILSMMSRVSLGHTGRPLEVPGYLSLAFGLILLAAIVRSGLPIIAANQTLLAWRASAILWIVVFGVFLYRYLPILTRPRADDPSGQGETKLK